MTSREVAEAFGQLLTAHRGAQIIVENPPQWWLAEMRELRDWPLDAVRALWDGYDGCNSPLGFAGEVIHAALNERGDGAYCAV